jgi:hypothetical protein
MPLPRLSLAALALLAAPALAEPIAGDAAAAMLYATDRVEVVTYTVEGLSEDEIALLTQVAAGQNYYAAVAFAPAEGILAEPTVMAANFHDIEAARAAAVRQCNERRQGGRACTVAFEVRPQGWEPRALQLSADATAAVAGDYARAGRPRAFAVSAATGQWGVGSGPDATAQALAQCRAAPGAGDCRVVIAD